MYPVGIGWANFFRAHNELTMYPLGKCPLAPSEEAFLRELQEEERISDLVATFQEYEIEEEEMDRWAETM